MTWTDPRTWADQDIFSAARANIYLRDNMRYLLSRPLGYTRQVIAAAYTATLNTWEAAPIDAVNVITNTGNVRIEAQIPPPVTQIQDTYWDIKNVTNGYFLSSLTGTPLVYGLTGGYSNNSAYAYGMNIWAVDEDLTPGDPYEYEVWAYSTAAVEVLSVGTVALLLAREI